MDPYLGEIRLFSFGVIPRGWHVCDGTLMNMQQNAALYSLLGIAYGGDGQTTFALPDLRGRVPTGSSTPQVGAKGGAESVTLTATQVPSHNHLANAYNGVGNQTGPAGNLPAQLVKVPSPAPNPPPTPLMYGELKPQAPSLAPTFVGSNAGNVGHENRQPSLALNYCIAIQGVYPNRP